MPSSPYVQELRALVGHRLLVLPGVTAVIRHDDRFLLAQQRDSRLWSLIGGGIEPEEEPAHAVAREVTEELGVTPRVGRIIGAYGGEQLSNSYPNGDRVSYVTVAYECTLPERRLTLEHDEVQAVAWVSRADVASLPRHRWIDRVLDDASGSR